MNTIDAPVNVLSLPGVTNCNKLKELGVQRFSFGNAFSDQYKAYWKENSARLMESMDTSHLYGN